MRIHFIGIGGIGVSALAKYYLLKGHKISGSDLIETEITQALTRQGAKIRIGPHKAENIPFTADMVIHSPAVDRNNPELQQARNLVKRKPLASRWKPATDQKNQILILSYPQALAELTKEHYTIAISGTHGKSTTTAMIGLILIKAGFDPTIIVGTKVKEFDPQSPAGSNCRMGQGTFRIKNRPVLVIEADEHFASFLNYSPDIIVLTTIEPDHLDYYKNLQNIIKAFKQYILLLPKDGIVIANKDDKNTEKVLKSSKHITHYYSSKWVAAKQLRRIIQVPGEYNISNAHAALTLAKALQIPDKIIYDTLAKFQGTWRRFEVFELPLPSGKPKKYTLVSDYGHHPTELRVTVNAARFKWPKKELWVVFQPHQYQRTQYFFRDFISTLSLLPIDKLIVSDIYDVAGREHKDITEKISSEMLVKQIIRKKGREHATNILHIPTLDEIETFLKENLKGGEVVMVMGAGDIYDLTLRLTGKIQKGKI